MTIKNRLESTVRGWFPKEPKMPKSKLNIAEAKGSKHKPGWWKPYWMLLVAITIALALVLLFFTTAPIERVVIGLGASLLCMGFAYYIRVRPSMRVNRAIFIMIGITPIGFVLWVICIYVLNRVTLFTTSTWPVSLLCFVACFGLGALIGDWIGKKRNYILPMTP